MTTPNLTCDTNFDFSLFQQSSYQLVFDKIPHVPFFCHSVNVPQVSMNTARVATPWHDINLSGEKMQYSNLVADILIDKNLVSYTEIFNWLRAISMLDEIKTDDVSVCTLIVGPLQFKMYGVFPLDVSDIRLMSNPNDTEPVTFNASFNVVSFDIIPV